MCIISDDDSPIAFTQLNRHVLCNCLFLSPCIRLLFHLQIQLHLYVYLFSNIPKCSPTSRSHSLQSHVQLSLHPYSVSPSLHQTIHLSVRLSVCLFEIAFVVGKLDLCTNSFRSRCRVSPSSFICTFSVPPFPISSFFSQRRQQRRTESEREREREQLLEMVYIRHAKIDQKQFIFFTIGSFDSIQSRAFKYLYLFAPKILKTFSIFLMALLKDFIMNST